MLPANSSTSLEKINKRICELKPDEVAALVELLQEQATQLPDNLIERVKENIAPLEKVITEAIEAIEKGADDYLSKPFLV